MGPAGIEVGGVEPLQEAHMVEALGLCDREQERGECHRPQAPLRPASFLPSFPAFLSLSHPSFFFPFCFCLSFFPCFFFLSFPSSCLPLKVATEPRSFTLNYIPSPFYSIFATLRQGLADSQTMLELSTLLPLPLTVLGLQEGANMPALV